VIVVDSAPRTDTTARALHGERTWPFPLRYVRCAQPGLARAHNAALRYVSAELVAFTDDDVLIDPHWVSAVAGGFANPSVACVTGLILPAELATVAQVRVEQAGGFARGYERRSFSLARPPADPLFPFTAGRLGSGANMAFRAEWLHAAGGFDAATGAGTLARGGDDLLAFLRVLLAGRTLVYEPSAIVRHRHRRGDDEVRAQAFGYGVGLGAYLTAAVRADPALLPRMLRRTGPAVRHLVARSSPKNAAMGDDYPRGLVWRERLGTVVGPVAYARSRRRELAAGTAA
jgi:glycosyltransferase involved in cell wall biosynthesis